MNDMNYTLFVTDGCESCHRVARHLKAMQVNFRTVNLSHPDALRPEQVIIVPALFDGDRLLAYGPDIAGVVSP
jgi:glutaredoxin